MSTSTMISFRDNKSNLDGYKQLPLSFFSAIKTKHKNTPLLSTRRYLDENQFSSSVLGPRSDVLKAQKVRVEIHLGTNGMKAAREMPSKEWNVDAGMVIGGDEMLFPLSELEKDLRITDEQDSRTTINGHFPELDDLFSSCRTDCSNLFYNSSFGSKALGPDESRLGDIHIISYNSSNDMRKQWENRNMYQHCGKNEAALVRLASRSRAKSLKRDRSSAPKKRQKRWTPEEDAKLRAIVGKERGKKICWKSISRLHFDDSRSAQQCGVRWRNHLRPGIVEGNWKPHEDRIIIKMVAEGHKWKDIANALTSRTRDSISNRYHNKLDPKLKTTPWTKEEDDILFNAQRQIGNKWSKIRKLLPGRSYNSIKNRFYNQKRHYSRKQTGGERGIEDSVQRTILATSELGNDV